MPKGKSVPRPRSAISSRSRSTYRKVHVKSRIAEVLAALTLMLGVAAAAATPSSAAATKTFSHTCHVVVDDGNTQGVFCVDLAGAHGGEAGDGTETVELRVTALCQYDADLPNSVTTQCSNVSLGIANGLNVWELTQNPGGYHSGEQDGCGHGQQFHPNCSTGRNYFGFYEDGIGPNGGVDAGSCYAFYGALLYGASINLPGSNKQGLVPTTNLSTPHVNINGAGNTC